MLYELRVYVAPPEKLPALIRRFSDHTKGYLDKHGINMMGCWTEEKEAGNQLICILTFGSMGDREERWGAFQADAGWQRVRAETESEGPLADEVCNTFMRLTPYSPEPSLKSSVQELRVYDAVPGKLPALHTRFVDHMMGLFERHGMENVAYWTGEVGASNRLVYMLGFPSLEDRKRSWAAIHEDPDWQKVVGETERDGPLTRATRRTVLRPIP